MTDMKNLVILIFIFFSFTLSAKEIVFKVTNSNRNNITKGQFIRIAPIYSDSNVNFGELQFYGDTSFNVNFFLKKNIIDFILFLKFNDLYDLYWLKFIEKTGNFILTNGVNNI